MKKEVKKKVIKKKKEDVLLSPVITPYQLGMFIGTKFNETAAIDCIKTGRPEQTLQSMKNYFNLLHSAEAYIKELEQEMIEMKNFVLKSGLVMSTEPFIPQYAGFEQKEMDGMVVYIKYDYILTQTGGKWNVVHGVNVYDFYFSNMFEAITVLESIGCYVPLEEVLVSGGIPKTVEEIVKEIKSQPKLEENEKVN